MGPNKHVIFSQAFLIVTESKYIQLPLKSNTVLKGTGKTQNEPCPRFLSDSGRTWLDTKMTRMLLE